MSTTGAPAHATATFCIAADHPALPGHFPGTPIVPGVLMLAEGLQRLEQLMPAPLHCQRIEQAKFLQPVAPGAAITVTMTMTNEGEGTVDFHVGGALAAQARLTVAAAGHATRA